MKSGNSISKTWKGPKVVPFIRVYRTRADYGTWFDNPEIYAMIVAELLGVLEDEPHLPRQLQLPDEAGLEGDRFPLVGRQQRRRSGRQREKVRECLIGNKLALSILLINSLLI